MCIVRIPLFFVMVDLPRDNFTSVPVPESSSEKHYRISTSTRVSEPDPDGVKNNEPEEAPSGTESGVEKEDIERVDGRDSTDSWVRNAKPGLMTKLTRIRLHGAGLMIQRIREIGPLSVNGV